MPLLVGTIYRWLGVGTPLAEFALSCLSVAFIYVSFLALDAGFKWLGVAPMARLGALVLLALVPLNLFLEVAVFRHWEAALAAAGIAVFLAGALALDARDRRPSWLELGLLACGAGLLRHPDYQYAPKLLTAMASMIASDQYDIVLVCSEDFVFDNEMLAQSIYAGFRIGEISCPTKYFPEASSISFRRR
jgi:hypothetical protein